MLSSVQTIAYSVIVMYAVLTSLVMLISAEPTVSHKPYYETHDKCHMFCSWLNLTFTSPICEPQSLGNLSFWPQITGADSLVCFGARPPMVKIMWMLVTRRNLSPFCYFIHRRLGFGRSRKCYNAIAMSSIGVSSPGSILLL